MSYTRKIAHNAIIQIFGKFLGLFFGVITIGLITRYLGTQGFGYYTTAFAFLQAFGIMIDFGLQMITVQIISDPNEDETKMLSNIFTLRFFTSLIFFVAPLIAIFFPYPLAVKLGIIITSFTYFFMSISTVLIGPFQKHLAMGKVAIADFLNKFIFFILIVSLVYLKKNILWIFSAAAISNALAFFFILYYAKKIHPSLRFLFEKDKWLLILSRSWPIALSIALNLVYFKADTIILSLTHSQEIVGLYGAPYKILEVLIGLSYIFLGLLLPFMTSTFAHKNYEKFKNIIQKGFDVMAIVAIPMVLGTLFLGKDIMILIAGNDYAMAGDILKILIIATSAIFIAAVFGYGIVAINKQKQMLIFYAFNAVISLVAYIYFIPRYSYWAAAWITAYSEIFILITSFFILYRNTRFIPSLKTFFKSLLSSAIMCLFIFNFPSLHILLIIILSSIIYCGTLILFRAVSKDTLTEILKFKG